MPHSVGMLAAAGSAVPDSAGVLARRGQRCSTWPRGRRLYASQEWDRRPGGKDARPLSSGARPSRTDEEIQILFDRYKAALYRIYNTELRKDPTLRGKMVLRISIEPSGVVSACSVESCNMDAPDFSAQIVARVKKFNFGPKDGVPKTSILYPIDFLPAR